MKKLTALILSATLAPALALGTVALAEEYGGTQAERQDVSEQRADKQRADDQFMDRTPVGALYAADVIGKTVRHRQSGDDIGEIQDLIIGEDGRILGAVVKTGGFLGLGGQDVSLGWDHLEHTMGDDESMFYVDMDEEMLRNAPEHERD
ncbi:PRC-barrel domain-containing protein [Halomonas sp. 328]|uniref:PRC-barrel domain-containing protein n=1 Tax=Halomonas sp. 328 TaxID=2776704 RepID=UPI0018A7088E|nr:PRC-barrel domain-containing protein [Halomonas sp. 328]MBF8221820.1 PRC-barrel domain-containing protein [Halomonas sp. 328]